MLRFIRHLLLITLISATSLFTHAEEDPFPTATALFPPLQVPSRKEGAFSRFSWIYGQHASIIGLDLGLVGNITDKLFIGTAISTLFNINSGKSFVVGAQFAGLTNYIKGDLVVTGVQLTAGLNKVIGTGHVVGAQIGLLGNIAPKTNIYGVQTGLYNEAADVYGFQVGLVNVARKLHGIQLGLINIQQKGAIRFFPLINVGF